MAWVTTDDVIDAIGFVAAVLVTVSLVPQIYRVHLKRSAKDLNFYWQVLDAERSDDGGDVCCTLNDLIDFCTHMYVNSFPLV